MKKFILFIICILLVYSKLHSQEIDIICASDKYPIEHVAVFNLQRDLSTISDSVGHVNLSIFGTTDTLVFQHPSFVTAQYTLSELKGTDRLALKRKNILIEEFVVSASKSRESKLEIPNMVDVIDSPHLAKSTGMTAADILEGSGNIMVQRTQGGGGSPVLRGFEANKILLVVDGVRMNNAIYRNGHLQNAITIDQAILDRAEVIFGPSSIIYGSDALGGVIHYYTRDPQLSGKKSHVFNANASSSFSSADRGYTGHLDIGYGAKMWSSLSSVTYKNFGDLQMGSRRIPTLGDWGRIMNYVDQVNGLDSTLVNNNPERQPKTGYSQWDLLQKIRYSPSKYVDWILNLQYSTSSDIHRLDKLNDYKGDNLKFAEYYYGPQNRSLVSLKNVLKKDNHLFTNMTNTLAFQRIDEDRISRKFRVDDRLIQEEDVYVYSWNTDLLKMWNREHRLNYGLEFNYNTVESGAWYTNIVTGEQTLTQTRYPEGGSKTFNASGYASYKWIVSPKILFNGGMRYSWSALHSEFTAGILPYDEIDIRNGALTGSLGIVYTPTDQWQVNSVFSTGFRNPNVDDYGKVRAKDEIITVPNDQLHPEYTYNAELGVTRIIEGYMKLSVVGYYSYLQDAIVRTWHTLNGLDSMLYDGDMYRIAANYNAAQAYIYGMSMRITANLNQNMSLNSTLNYTRGQNITDDVPLGHIPPIFGRTTLRYEQKHFFFDTYAVYNGWKRTEDFSPFGEDNETEAMEYGFPAWWTLNLKAGYRFETGIEVVMAVENLLDTFYKTHASGIAAPGRNFIFTARFNLG